MTQNQVQFMLALRNELEAMGVDKDTVDEAYVAILALAEETQLIDEETVELAGKLHSLNEVVRKPRVAGPKHKTPNDPKPEPPKPAPKAKPAPVRPKVDYDPCGRGGGSYRSHC